MIFVLLMPVSIRSMGDIDVQTLVEGNMIFEEFKSALTEQYVMQRLTNDEPKEKINLKFTAYSKNLKQNLENLFPELNRMDFITSKQMYNDALKLFHVEIRQVQKGNLVFVTDGNGNPVWHPIKMSDFEERPRFYQSKGKTEKIESANDNSVDKSQNDQKNGFGNSQMLIDLLRLIPNYSDKNSFRKKKQFIKMKRKRQMKG